MRDCPRAGRLFGGNCKFSPRYDQGSPGDFKADRCTPEGFVAVLEASKPITYVRDVCERCGKTVERN